MSKARDRIIEARYRVHHAEKPRRIALIHEGRLLTGHADQSKQRAGRLFRLRLRIRRFVGSMEGVL